MYTCVSLRFIALRECGEERAKHHHHAYAYFGGFSRAREMHALGHPVSGDGAVR